MKKLKVLLLGPTGRIGKYFIEDYNTYGYNKEYELILGLRNKDRLKHLGLELRDADISDFEGLKKAFVGIDVVLNLAGNISLKQPNRA